MINESDSEYEFHSTSFEILVDSFPEGGERQAAAALLKVVDKTRAIVQAADYEEAYASWFGQFRECLSGRDCEDPMIQKIGSIVEEYEIPHQFVFDLLKGIKVEQHVNSFRDFPILETCAYLNSSTLMICFAQILGGSRPDERCRQALIELGLADYLLHKLSNFVPQLESKVYFLAFQEVQDRGLDLMDLTEPIDDGLWKDLIQYQCRRILEKLQVVSCLTELPAGRFRRALNRLTVHNLTLLKKIRRMPSLNLRSRVLLTWSDRFRAKLNHWKSFKIPTE